MMWHSSNSVSVYTDSIGKINPYLNVMNLKLLQYLYSIIKVKKNKLDNLTTKTPKKDTFLELLILLKITTTNSMTSITNSGNCK